MNITGSLLALGASKESADMLSDFQLKATHLLRPSAPRVQFYVQFYTQSCGATSYSAPPVLYMFRPHFHFDSGFDVGRVTTVVR